MALLPLFVVSWISYYAAERDLTEAAKEKLEQSAVLNVNFIENWFEYRVMDANTQAELYSNISLLKQLGEGYKQSGKPLAKYVKSFDWVKRVDRTHNNLIKLSRQYDYISDLILIDNKGNILYSVAKDSDLGTNIFTGRLAQTTFSSTVAATQDSGKVFFSGLERYAPADDAIAGFITAPLLDEDGTKLGIFAVQLRFDRIFNLLNNKYKLSSSLIHYLISDNGSLRTPYNKGNWNEVLKRRIDTEPYQHWFGHETEHLQRQKKSVNQYLGPDGRSVIGAHHIVKLGIITWLFN